MAFALHVTRPPRERGLQDQKKDELIKSLYKTAWMVLPALTVIGSALVLSGVL